MVNILFSNPEQERNFFKSGSELIIVNSEPDESALNAQIQEMSPEVVAVDLSVADANKTLGALAECSTDSKILAINAPNKAVMLSAIAIGASGSTKAEISPYEFKLVLQSLELECVLVDSKRSENPHFLVLPKSSQIAKKLDSMQYLIGIEILNYWRTESFPYSLTVPACLVELGLSNLFLFLERGTGKTSITKELDRIVESLCQQKNYNTLAIRLKYIEGFLKNWYFNEKTFTSSHGASNCCLATININARQVRKLSVKKLQKFLFLWKKAGSYTLCQWLEELISSLKTMEVEFEQTHQEALKIASFSQSAYQNWYKKILLDEEQSDFKSAVRALRLSYQFSFRTSKCNMH